MDQREHWKNGAGLTLSAETGGLLFGFYTLKQCFEKGYFECKSRALVAGRMFWYKHAGVCSFSPLTWEGERNAGFGGAHSSAPLCGLH